MVEPLFAALSTDQKAELLEYLQDDLRGDLAGDLSATELAPVLDQMDEDVAADIVQDLEPEQQEAVVSLLEEREEIEELLSYPEESAAGRMSTEYVALRRRWTVDEAIAFLRSEIEDADQTFYLYVVDDDEHLIGVVGLRNLITSSPDTPIAAIMSRELPQRGGQEDQEVAAERMRHYNLLALPVVDDDNCLLGVITADDVLDVQVQEATEDMLRMAGVGVQERAFSPVLDSARRRIPWLTFNMAWAFAGAAIIGIFNGTLDKAAGAGDLHADDRRPGRQRRHPDGDDCRPRDFAGRSAPQRHVGAGEEGMVPWRDQGHDLRRRPDGRCLDYSVDLISASWPAGRCSSTCSSPAPRAWSCR